MLNPSYTMNRIIARHSVGWVERSETHDLGLIRVIPKMLQTATELRVHPDNTLPTDQPASCGGLPVSFTWKT